MKKIIISTLAVSALLMNTACNTDFDQDVKNIKVTNGSADFSNYVALGNSLTSGYRDGVLYQDGQLESYPNMIAEQMKLAGGGDFTQPLMPDNIGGFADFSVKGKYTLQVVNGSLLPVQANAEKNFERLTGTFNNMGVPGAKSFHLVAPGYGSSAGNPYFARFASSTTTTVLADAMAKKPTFFSLWIGNNDVLSYATSGGAGKNQTGNIKVSEYSSDDITDPQVFAGSIKAILEGMKSVGTTKGVIANIPSVTDIPFFTTIPYNAIPLDEANATELNKRLVSRMKPILAGLGQGDRFVSLTAGQNPLLIKDESLVDVAPQITAILQRAGFPAQMATLLGSLYGQARHATSEDLILLTTRQEIGKDLENIPSPFNKVGVTYPLEDKFVLTKAEIAEIKTATEAYNTAIKSLANQYNLAFVDANAKMVELSKASGIQWDGVKYNARFVTGGAFSLDGVHLTGRGYGIIANEFIKAINEKYGSTLSQVNPNKYSGIKFP